MSDYYADLIGNITVTGPLVRIDYPACVVGASAPLQPRRAPCGRSQASPAPHQPPQQQGTQFQVAHRLVMPLDGFLRSLDAQEQMRAKLIADSVIKIADKDAAAPAENGAEGNRAEAAQQAPEAA